MPRPREEISTERLFAAVEASLKATAELRAFAGGLSPYPPDLMGTPSQPECLAEFTKHEVGEACAFLVRMGVLSPPRRLSR